MFEPCSLFSMYANRQQNIEDFIELLAATPNADEQHIQQCLAIKCGITSLTSDEKEYIEKEVVKRCIQK